MRQTKVLFVKDDSVAAAVRMEMPAAELQRRGWSISVRGYNGMPNELPSTFDIAVFQRPLVDLTKVIAFCKAKGTKVVVDMDDDFMGIPKTHPGYGSIGPGNPDLMAMLLYNLVSCDHLVLATEELQRRLSPANHETSVIRNCWDDHNKVWYSSKRYTRNHIAVGWAGSLTHAEDWKHLPSILTRLAQKDARIKVVIGADPEFYRLLVRIPEEQRLFIPGMHFTDYPFMLRQLDVLLVPLKNTEFNAAKSDIKLVEGGAAAIPCIVSNVPCYSSSELVSNWFISENEWEKAIEHAVNDELARVMMGEYAHELVQPRAISKQTGWEELLRGL